MKRAFKSHLVMVLLLISASFSSHGALIKTDYMAGDGLAVTDTTQGLKWLNLTLTDGLTRVDALAAFSGYRMATESEVAALFYELFVTARADFGAGANLMRFYVADPAWTATLAESDRYRDLFGETFLLTDGSYAQSYGTYANDDGNWRMSGVLFRQDDRLPVFNDYGSTCPNIAFDACAWNGSSSYGVFLVTDAAEPKDVSEPSVALILMLGMLVLLSRSIRVRRLAGTLVLEVLRVVFLE